MGSGDLPRGTRMLFSLCTATSNCLRPSIFRAEKHPQAAQCESTDLVYGILSPCGSHNLRHVTTRADRSVTYISCPFPRFSIAAPRTATQIPRTLLILWAITSTRSLLQLSPPTRPLPKRLRLRLPEFPSGSGPGSLRRSRLRPGLSISRHDSPIVSCRSVRSGRQAC